jgi:hypothetical protein
MERMQLIIVLIKKNPNEGVANIEVVISEATDRDFYRVHAVSAKVNFTRKGLFFY